jgi:hypothetical protein
MFLDVLIGGESNRYEQGWVDTCLDGGCALFIEKSEYPSVKIPIFQLIPWGMVGCEGVKREMEIARMNGPQSTAEKKNCL